MKGDAILYPMHDNAFGSAIGLQLSEMMPHSLHFAACWAIILLQLCFSFLIYLPVKHYAIRACALIAAACMHIGFIFLMQIHLFPFLSLIYLVLLFPDHWISNFLAKRRAQLEKIRIFYDPDCGFCKSTAVLFKEFCLSPSTPVAPSDSDDEAHTLLQKHYSWIVYGHDNNIYMKWKAVAYICRQSPVFWIFGVFFDLPGIRQIMARVYEAIGNNRGRLGQISKVFLTPSAYRYPDMTQQVICSILLGLMVSYTVWALPQIKTPIPEDLERWAMQTQTWQTWDLFAPYPVAYQRSLDVSAVDQNANDIPLKPYLDRHFKMKGEHFDFASPRLFKYYNAMYPEKNPRHRMGFARYLCWKTYKDGTPAKTINLNLSIKHAFHKNDRYSLSQTYTCSALMNQES